LPRDEDKLERLLKAEEREKEKQCTMMTLIDTLTVKRQREID
jgi:hypothetical protein